MSKPICHSRSRDCSPPFLRRAHTHLILIQETRRERIQQSSRFEPARMFRTKTTAVRSTIMTGFRTLIIATMMSIGAISSASAQCPLWATQHPNSFQAQYPDRDALNDCELTPAGRMGLERPGGAAPLFGPSRAHEKTPGVAQHQGFHHRSR